MTKKNDSPGITLFWHKLSAPEVAKRMMDEIRQRGKHDI